MYGAVGAAEMMTNVMDLRMTVMAAGDAIISACFDNLIIFLFAIGSALFRITRLEKTAAAATTVVVGSIWRHFNDIFFAHHHLNNIAKIVSHCLTIPFSYYLAGILDGKLDFPVFIPIGVYFKSAFTNPLGIILVD